MNKEAMKLALEALESCGWNDGYAGENQYFHDDLVDKAITAVREALSEQPAQQEPVQRYSPDGEGGMEIDSLGAWVKFTSPQPAQQEPVAWRWSESNGQRWFDWTTDWSHHDKAKSMNFPIEYAYTQPPAQRKPLTDEKVEKIIKDNMVLQMNLAGIRQDFEAAHGIKENT